MDYLFNKATNSIRQYTSLQDQVKSLKRDLEELQSLKEDAESRKLAGLRPGKKLKKQVENWLINVGRVNDEVQKLEDEFRSGSFLTHGLLGQQVLKKMEEVKDLIQKGKFSDGLVVDEHAGIGQMLPITYIKCETMLQDMENIWELVTDEAVGLIGVYGMGGVGKTTIMKQINNRLLNERDVFGTVIWVTVSKDSSLFRLQTDIAKRLNVDLSKEEDETIRAGKLSDILSKRGRFAIILDDLWDKLSLDQVGIPEPSNGSKLLITTRSLEICRYMNCKAVKVQPLQKEEAWNLFLEKVGRDILNYSNLESMVKSVAKECAGLPLAIVTVASSMRSIRDPAEWRNALNELRKNIKSVNDIDGQVFQRVRFSYDRLNDTAIQKCFLCFALFPEDFCVAKANLIRYWLVDGLLDEMDSLKDKIDRGYTIINKLTNNCLLENVWGPLIKMHDVVRDMAIHITKSIFVIKSGMQIRELPDTREWPEDVEKVSLMSNRISEITLAMPSSKLGALTTLLLCSNQISWIPERFFEHLCSLKLIDLSYNPIVSLPASVCSLPNLSSLLLECCHCLEEIPSLSRFQALECLDLWGTKINLVKLFDGAGFERVESFAGCFDNVLEFNSFVAKGLHYLGDFPTTYRLGIVNPSRVRVFFGVDSAFEVSRRSIMEYVDVGSDVVIMPTNVEELRLLQCRIGKSLDETFPCLKDQTNFQQWRGLPGTTTVSEAAGGVFSSLKKISIWSCGNIRKLFSARWLLHGLQCLEEIWIVNCQEMEEIVGSDGEGEVIRITLPRLRVLNLQFLPKLESICGRGAVLVCHLLEQILITGCEKLKRIPVSVSQVDDGQPFVPPLLGEIEAFSEEWWESLEWDLPNVTRHLLQPILAFKKQKLENVHQELLEERFPRISCKDSFWEDLEAVKLLVTKLQHFLKA